MKKGKIVILGGTPRAGKTTVANRLAEKGFNIIPFDYIVHAVHDGLPEVILGNENKREYWSNQEMASEKFYLFFETLIKDFVNDSKVYGLNYVIDMYAFTPQYINKLPFQEEIEVYFLGYPNKSTEEIVQNIKLYSKPTDWIMQFINDEIALKVLAERFYEMNEKISKQCTQYGYNFINTDTGDKRSIALNDLFDKISTTY